jgi:hypothetical protein
MDDSRINEIAKELDNAIPKDGAKADWRRQELVANRQGLLRLAVELLYAATAPLKQGHEVTDRKWDYLWTSQPPDDFDDYPLVSRISRTESVDLPPPPPPTRRERITNTLSGLFVLALIFLFVTSSVIGCYTIFKKL